MAYLEYEVGEVEGEHGADPDDLQSLSCVNRATIILINIVITIELLIIITIMARTPCQYERV